MERYEIGDHHKRRGEAEYMLEVLRQEPTATFDVYCNSVEQEQARGIYLDVLGPQKINQIRFFTIWDR